MESQRVLRARRQENRANRDDELALQRVSSELESESRSPTPPKLEELESLFQSQEQHDQIEHSDSDSQLQAQEQHQQPEPQIHLKELHQQPEPQIHLKELHQQPEPQIHLKELHQQPEPQIHLKELHQQPEPQIHLKELHQQVEPSEPQTRLQEQHHQTGQSASPLELQERHQREELAPPLRPQQRHLKMEQTSQPKSQWQDPEQCLQTEEITKSQLELQDQMEQEPEQNGVEPSSPDLPPRGTRNRPELYNFKGFMLFCFGVPGVSPNWCSCLLFFYHVLLFTVGIGTVILGGISLALRREMSHTKQFVFADVLSILAGLLYLLAAAYGGCIWTWRTSFLPRSCTKSFLPLSILAWILSLSHAALVAAFVTVMINNGQDIVQDDIKFELNMLSLWTLGGLAIWAFCFLLGFIPSIMLFRRKYRPTQV